MPRGITVALLSLGVSSSTWRSLFIVMVSIQVAHEDSVGDGVGLPWTAKAKIPFLFLRLVTMLTRSFRFSLSIPLHLNRSSM
jgi:hypothetical protein